MQIMSAGLVNKWMADEMMKVTSWESVESSMGSGAFSLYNLQAAFFLLLLGGVLAAITLVAERLVLPQQC